MARYKPPISTANNTKYVMNPEHYHGTPGRRRDIDVIDRHRHGQQRIHSADLQPQLRDAAAVARNQKARAIGAFAGLRVRAVGEQQERRGERGRNAARIPRAR